MIAVSAPVIVLGAMASAWRPTKMNMPSDTVAAPTLLNEPWPLLFTLTVIPLVPGGRRPATTPSSLSSRSRPGAPGGTAARIGLSDPATGVRALHDACHDAALAPRIAEPAETCVFAETPRIARPAETGVFAIADLRVPQVLAAASHQARARFVELLLGPLRADPDWPTQRDTLIAWARSGFNLVRAADALHVHRNRLLYRLDRITQRCGRAVREPDAALALYCACVAERLTTEPGPASRASGSGSR